MGETLRRYLDVLPFLVRLHVKAQMEYRAAYLIDRLAQIVTYAAYYTALFVLLARFGALDGWTWPEMALLFSIQILAWALGASFTFTQFRGLEEQVRLGTVDALLVRPINSWAYISFAGYNIGYLSHLILAGGLMAWSLTQVAWGPGQGLYLVLALVNGALINGAVMTIFGATALVWVRSSHLYTVFFGLWELCRFPISIYPVPIQAMLLTVIPLGYATYVPVAYFLGKPISLIGDIGGPLTLLVGPALVLVAIVHWRYAISRYQSGGG